MSMNPGASTWPRASITRSAESRGIALRRHADDLPAGDRDVAGECRRAGTVDDAGVRDDKIVRRHRRQLRARHGAGARGDDPVEEREVLLLGHARVVRRSRDRLVRDDHVELWNDGDVLADRAEARVRAFVRSGVPRPVEHPPQVAVSDATAPHDRRVELRDRRDDAGGLGDPVARHDLLAVPVPVVEHQEPDARHVARREKDRVGRMDRPRGVAFLLLEVAPEVLHADRARELFLRVRRRCSASFPARRWCRGR